MSLLDEIGEAQARVRKCGLGDAIRSMDLDLANQVTAALLDRSLQSTAITSVLKKRGYQINRFQVAECRKACECGAICG